jgi:hypothetical protein
MKFIGNARRSVADPYKWLNGLGIFIYRMDLAFQVRSRLVPEKDKDETW